jgi:hypothetical protein
MGPLRFLLLSTHQALLWRWEIAQLELGCRFGWPRPGARQWAARARRISVMFQSHPGHAALVFEGYTLVAVLWSRGDDEILLSGPFVMPQFRKVGLEAKLQSLLCSVRTLQSTRDQTNKLTPATSHKCRSQANTKGVRKPAP